MRKDFPATVTLEAGDFFTGHGKLDRLRTHTYLKSLEKIGYDAVLIHPSSFSMGLEYFRESTKNISIPFISLNAHDRNTGELLGRPFVIKDMGQFRVAVMAVTDNMPATGPEKNGGMPGHFGKNESASDNGSGMMPDAPVTIMHPLESLREYLPLMRAQADIIILMSSLGFEKEASIAAQFREIDVILSSDSTQAERIVGSTLIVGNPSREGRSIGKLALAIDSDGVIAEHRIDWLSIRKTYAEDHAIRRILSEFYEEVADKKEYWEDVEPLFAALELEKNESNRYMGAGSCEKCHEEIFNVWRRSKHADAYNTLVRKNRYFYPDCVRCHATGVGYESGFKIDQTTKHLEGVQCEICHGPGSDHLISGGDADMRTALDEKFCTECHSADISPNFKEHFEQMLAMVNHSAPPVDPEMEEPKQERPRGYPNITRLRKEDPVLFERLFEGLAAGCRSNHLLFECKGEEAAEKRSYLDRLLESDRNFDSLMSKMVAKYGDKVRSGEKEKARYKLRQQGLAETINKAVEESGEASLELFVISYGPNAIRIEKLLYELQDEMFGDALELALRFIARERGPGVSAAGRGDNPSDRFESHNGKLEIDEDMRQILIQKYYPDRLKSYLFLRNQSIATTDWKICARAAGINIEDIERRIENNEGAYLLSEDIGLAQNRGVAVSPALFINGKRYIGKFEK